MPAQAAPRRAPFRPDNILTATNRAAEPRALMDLLQERLPDHKRAALKVLLKYGHVRAQGVVTHQFDQPVAPGESIEINLTRPFVVFRHPRMQIVYEDDAIIVVNKGYGLLSVGTGAGKKEETAYGILKDYVKRVDPRQKVFVVHRLDRQTSGLMMFAKSPEAQAAMQHNWNNMVIARRYVAVVEGAMKEQSGVVRSTLDETSQFEVYSTPVAGAGRMATTRYRVLERGGGYTLAAFELDTGRKNQIRVHAHDLGHPIVGDRKYGAKASPIGRLALHAQTLRFAHPTSRKDMNFELPVPSRFISLLRHK